MSDTKRCPFCAEFVQSAAIKCRHCNEPIEPGVCLRCRKINRVEAAFCGHCGSNKLIHLPGWRPGEPAGRPKPQGPSKPDASSRADSGPDVKAAEKTPAPPREPRAGAGRVGWVLSGILLAAVAVVLFFRTSGRREPPASSQAPAVVPPAPASGMVLIPAGEFWMGSPDGEGSGDEHPRHRVYLDGYYIDKTEVTVAQYRRFSQETGRAMWAQPDSNKDDHPVVNVDWNDADAYCRWAEKRLPTEAEWEKAARGGAETKYHFGNSESELGDYAWYGSNSGGGTHPVGQKKPNQYGLYDMHGNVWEWVADWYDDKYYRNTPERNPTGPSSGSHRGLRGGAWFRGASNSRAAVRRSSSRSAGR